MSHTLLRPFIVKVSVLGYFPQQLKYKINNVLLLNILKYYIICLFHSSICLFDF